MRSLVLGIGNPILSDDGVGLEVTKKMEEMLPCGIDVRRLSVGGLAILDEIDGYDRLVVVDSIKTKKGNPGEVYKLSLNELGSTFHLCFSHGMDFATVFELGKRLGYRMPKTIDIYAIEIEDNTTFYNGCTDKVKRKIPEIADKIVEMIEWL